jgi:hypothetical protein
MKKKKGKERKGKKKKKKIQVEKKIGIPRKAVLYAPAQVLSFSTHRLLLCPMHTALMSQMPSSKTKNKNICIPAHSYFPTSAQKLMRTRKRNKTTKKLTEKRKN